MSVSERFIRTMPVKGKERMHRLYVTDAQWYEARLSSTDPKVVQDAKECLDSLQFLLNRVTDWDNAILQFTEENAPVIQTSHGMAKIYKVDLYNDLFDEYNGQCRLGVQYCVIDEACFDQHHAYIGYWPKLYILRLLGMAHGC